MLGRIRDNSPARNVLLDAPAEVVALLRFYLQVNDSEPLSGPLVVIHLNQYESSVGRAVALHHSDLYEFETPYGVDNAEVDELIQQFRSAHEAGRCFIFEHSWRAVL